MLLGKVKALDGGGVDGGEEELSHVQELTVVLFLQLYDF